ncbi:MAG: hypothetical protein CEE38_01735 [Planctomycetes bacterium B3_Pla]|nr:MAG: hypothetical protein CEE38_01735 [Planctomycetes bacterium B3_Pla]
MRVKPFKAFRFDSGVVGDVGSCIAPPYDVISPAQQQQLYEKSKHNIVRIIKGKTTASDNGDNNQYTRAAGYLSDWIERGALKQDLAEAIYAYVQDFEWAGATFQRLAFIALAELEEFGKVVKPHEQILNKPMVDRLNLKRATAAGFGLVFMLYEDEQKVADEIIKQATTAEPLIDLTDEQNVRHRLFAITAGQDTGQIVKMMSDKSCVIADGHHRYTTGLSYSRESSNPAARYQMLAFANVCQKGLIVLPTHRLVGNLEEFCFEKLIGDLKVNFELAELKFASAEAKTDSRQGMLAQMKARYTDGKNAFGIYGSNNAFYVAVLKDEREMDSVAPDMSSAWRALDVSVLHKLILEGLLGIDEEKLAQNEHVQYVKDTPGAIDDSIAQVDAGHKQAAFFMNPVKMQQLIMVTDAGERMPQKSTYFYPKVYTGLTIHKL